MHLSSCGTFFSLFCFGIPRPPASIPGLLNFILFHPESKFTGVFYFCDVLEGVLPHHIIYAINIICNFSTVSSAFCLFTFSSVEITRGSKTIHFELGLMKGVVLKYVFLL